MRRTLFSSVGRVISLIVLLCGLAVSEHVEGASCLVAPTNLVSWWRGETNLLDSWDSNNGTSISGLSFAQGKVGLGFSNMMVFVPDSSSLHFTNGLTIQAWINGPTSTNQNPYTIVSKYQFPFSSIIATQSSFYLGITNNGHLFFMVSSNGVARSNVVLTTTQTLTAGQWNFVVATYDHTHLRLYINGQLAIAKDFFSGIFPGTANLGIGGQPVGPEGGNPIYKFPGTIDEVCLYNRALSAAEILALYSADTAGMCLAKPTITGPQSLAVPLNEDAFFSVSVVGNRPLSFQWRFNGTNILAATNSSFYIAHVQSNHVGNYSVLVTNQAGSVLSQNAALTLLPPLSCAPPSQGIISWWPGDGFNLDVVGTNNPLTPIFDSYPTGKVGLTFLTRAIIPSSPSLNFGTNTNFSIEGWIKATPTNILIQGRNLTNETFVSKISITAGYQLALQFGRLTLQLGSAPPNLPLTNTFTAPGADLRDGRWHHIGCTINRSATNGGHLYVDGVNTLTFELTHISGSLSNNASFLLGFSPRQALAISSLVDEFTIYGRALTGDEMASVYHAGSAGKCKNPPQILTQPASQTVTATSNATFTVTALGLGLHYQWRFNSADIAHASSSSLTLTNVSTANAGGYSVRVTNPFGVVTSSVASLTVRSLPIARCTNVLVSAGPTCAALASIDAGSFDPNGGPITLSQTPPGPYPLGTNLVMLSVTDTNGVMTSCSALVVVVDTSPPNIACPADLTVEFVNESGAAVSFVIQASDNCSSVVRVVSVPASGSVFPIGITTVSNSATDAAGNSAACAFQVNVLGSQGVLSNVLSDLTALQLTVTRRPEVVALDAAITNIHDSLDAALWLDQTHITRSHGEQVFNDDKAAAQDLYRLVNLKQSTIDGNVLQALIDRIVKADRLLATVAIHDALAAGADSKKLAQAINELSTGDTNVADAKYEAGLAQYLQAWRDALQQTLKLRVRLAAGRPVLEFDASPGDEFVIESSTNLIDWTALATVSAGPDGTVRFKDRDGHDSAFRFYRAGSTHFK